MKEEEIMTMRIEDEINYVELDTILSSIHQLGYSIKITHMGNIKICKCVPGKKEVKK